MTDNLRIERTIKIINYKKKELWDALGSRDFDEIYRITVELLNWIVNCNELFFHNNADYRRSRKKSPEIEGVILGLKQAYNSFKHNMSIISVEETKHIKFIKTENEEIMLEKIVWLPSTELIDDNNSKEAFEAYQQYLEGEQIIVIFSKAIKYINEYNHQHQKSIARGTEQ